MSSRNSPVFESVLFNRPRATDHLDGGLRQILTGGAENVSGAEKLDNPAGELSDCSGLKMTYADGGDSHSREDLQGVAAWHRPIEILRSAGASLYRRVLVPALVNGARELAWFCPVEATGIMGRRIVPGNWP